MLDLRGAMIVILAGLVTSCASADGAAHRPATGLAGEAAPATFITRATAARMATAQLARTLLDGGAAAPMVGHELRGSAFPEGPLGGVAFFPPARPSGSELCRRDTLLVSLAPVEGESAGTSRRDAPVRKQSVRQTPQIALAPGCRLRRGGHFAWVQNSSWEEAAAALQRLAALQREARKGGGAGVALRCSSELDAGRCAGGAQAVLAQLPLHRMFIVQPRDEAKRAAWTFTVMPAGPGQPFWAVELADGGAGGADLHMRWELPAPA
jgi:hypothetical protein